MLPRAERGLWDRSLKFCVCRNPYDRLVSAWSFGRQHNKLNVPFDYFVRYMHTFDSFWVVWHCVLPQKQHVLIDDVPVIDMACRYETLERDFERIRAASAGRVCRCPIATVRHTSPTRHTTRASCRTVVFERFQVDFEYFGYPYELDGAAPARADAARGVNTHMRGEAHDTSHRLFTLFALCLVSGPAGAESDNCRLVDWEQRVRRMDLEPAQKEKVAKIIEESRKEREGSRPASVKHRPS